jgi:acetylornithine deacetylase
MAIKAQDILLDLVAIPSVSAMSNVPVIDYAEQYLAGWSVERYPYRDQAGVEKVNLVARTKPGTPELAFVCHTDTVPYDPEWAEAVRPAIRGGKLYGRGSADVKGFLACVLASIGRVDISKFSKPAMIVLTADEEIGCVGAKFLARKKVLRARNMVIGEPTGLRPVCAGKGYALAEIVVRGKEAHSAFPARGRSAIFDAARVVTALERVAKKLEAKKNRAFDPPFTTLNVGLIQGGTAKNIVAGECRITVEWRPVPGESNEKAAELIREALKGLPEIHARLDIKRLDPAFSPSPAKNLGTLVESLTGRRATTVSFGTEAAHLSGMTSEAIVFGPGDMTVAHKSGEFVPVKDLDECVGHLVELMRRLCLPVSRGKRGRKNFTPGELL